MAIEKLYECKISKRGKGARGTVEVMTFGKPVVNDDGIAKEWDYSLYRSLKTQEMLDLLELHARHINIGEALFRGADAMLKSTSLQSNSQMAILSEYILSNDLAQDSDEAEAVAKSWIDLDNACRKAQAPIFSLEDHHDRREKAVNKLKKEGNWKPRLISETEDSE